MLDIKEFNLIGSSYKKNAYKHPNYLSHSFHVLETH